MAKKMTFKKMNLLERIYIPEIIKGLWITLKEFFSRKVTMQYPEERWTPYKNWRGAPVLRWDSQNDREKCVACFCCMFNCPPEAIYIEAEEAELGKGREKRPAVFEINMGVCIFCGYCEQACPEDAIFMSKEYELADFTRTSLIRDKKMLLDLGEKAEKLEKENKWQ